jgi:histone H1/5
MAPKAAPKVAPAHPQFAVMISTAISSLKDRTGSSAPAIAKYIESNYKGLSDNWKKLLSLQLRRLVEAQKLVKVSTISTLHATKWVTG